jgi:hypothetical protein
MEQKEVTTALATYTSPAQLTVQEMMRIGDLFYQSGLFTDIRGAAQATTKIIAGQELGIPPFAAMNGFHIIKGKAAMGANLIGATIKRSGKYDYIVREMTTERCEIEFFQAIDGKRESIGKSEFTIADAKKAGTQNLDKYPRNMLFARAISNGARWYTPDVFLGPIYTPEELGAQVDEAGDVIPGASFAPPQMPEPQTEAEPPPVDPAFAATVKRLRDCEVNTSGTPPIFTRAQARDSNALANERTASKSRLYSWILSKADADTVHQVPSLEELDDQGLIDLAYATAGL